MRIMDFFMIGPLKKYKSTQALQIAEAMAYLGTHHYKEQNVLNDQIKTLSNAYRV